MTAVDKILGRIEHIHHYKTPAENRVAALSAIRKMQQVLSGDE
jgi:hypothetical protein